MGDSLDRVRECVGGNSVIITQIASKEDCPARSIFEVSAKIADRTAEISLKSIEQISVPKNSKLAVISSLAGSAVGGLLYNWGPAIMARSIVNGSIAAGAQWGIPAGLCRIGAMAYIGAVGVPNLPPAVIALSSAATTCAVIGVGNAIIDYSCWGKEDKAEEIAKQLENTADELEDKTAEITKEASEMQNKFESVQKRSDEQLALLAALQESLSTETDPSRKEELQSELEGQNEAFGQIAREVSLSQQNFLALSKRREEGLELSRAARFALSHAKANLRERN